MPRIDFEADEENLWELAAFERRPRSAPPRPNARVLQKTPAQPSKLALSWARRTAAYPDSHRLRAVIAQYISNEVTAFDNPPGWSLVTPNVTRLIFQNYYLNGRGMQSARRYRHDAKINIACFNQERSHLKVKLGTVGIFGLRDRSLDGRRNIGLTITEGQDELMEERASYLQAFVKDKELLKRLTSHEIPHISLAATSIYSKARSIATDLEGAEIEDASITLGPIELLECTYTVSGSA